jgi:hypothetical protein
MTSASGSPSISGFDADEAKGLAGRNEHERALFGAEEIADAFGVGLDRDGQLIPGSVLRERDDVISDAIVPDGVALFERALWVSKFSRAIGEAHDEHRHWRQSYRHPSCRRRPRRLAGNEHSEVVRLDLEDDPQLVDMADEVAHLGDLALVMDLGLTPESEGDTLKLSGRGHGVSSSAPPGAMAWDEERQSGKGAVYVLAAFPRLKDLNEALAYPPGESGKEQPVPRKDRLVCEGPDRLRVPLPRWLSNTSGQIEETTRSGGFEAARMSCSQSTAREVTVVGLGVGGWWQRRHASQEAEKQRRYTSDEAKAARDHATAEARATRRFEIRLEAYREASRFLANRELWVRRTKPAAHRGDAAVVGACGEP